MESKLYVGNLSLDTRDEDLRQLFTGAGTLRSVQIMVQRDTGESKGFGFIEMSTPEEAQRAIEMFNGSQLHERALTVNVAKPREERRYATPDTYQRRGNFNSDYRPQRREGGGRDDRRGGSSSGPGGRGGFGGGGGRGGSSGGRGGSSSGGGSRRSY